jgi:hypothetical protein
MPDNPLSFVTSEDLVGELRRRHPNHVMLLVTPTDGGQELVRTFAGNNLIVNLGLTRYFAGLLDAQVVATAKAAPDNRIDGLDTDQLPPQVEP